MSLFSRFIGKLVRRGELTIRFPDGRVETFGAPDPAFEPVTIHIADNAVLRRIALDPRLGTAEAYMDGRLVIEQGDIMALISLIRANRPWERGRPLAAPSRASRVRSATLAPLQQLNDRRRSRTNVAHHYDLGNDFYRLFLDGDMQYSCAYFSDSDMTLEDAQTAKKAHIAAKLHLNPGMRVLDIGCGWGGMALYLHRTAGVDVLGITLSAEQLALARERARVAGVAEHVRFELIDYRELAERETGNFDRIVSVGMFEHVGRPNFRNFFRCCHNLLTADGIMLLHTIGRFGGPGSTDAFTQKYIFPGGYIPALSEIIAASEPARLIATDIETLRLHYAKTLRHWYARTQLNRERIVAMYDERFLRMWTFYLAGATAAFESGGMGNYQLQYARDRRTLPLTRSYVDTAETTFLAKR